MTWQGQIYYCMHCKNIVRVIGEGEGVLICCGAKMKLLNSKLKDEQGKEKHVPVVKLTPEGIWIMVGDEAHPMDEAHYITWIQLEIDGISHEKTLTFKEDPKAFFPRVEKGDENIARIVCNRHLLWENQF